MDPTTLLTVIAFAGSAVFHKATDKAIDAAWQKLKNGWKAKTGKDLTPASASVDLARTLGSDSDLHYVATEVFRASPALKRAMLVKSVFNGADVLWIDDRPENQVWEIRLLELLGARVRQAASSDEARGSLRDGTFDVILSDIAREGRDDEGVRFAEETELTLHAPVIFYVYRMMDAPAPAGAFGITNRVNDLLHMICDVLERSRI